jgi:predicted nucleic acid-binding protein
VSTRLPEEFRLPPDDALRLLEDEILSRFRVHQLPHGAAVSFFRTAVEDRVMGGRIYDAHIASLALAARARTVVTENPRHFRSLEHHGIRVYTAEQYAAARGW